MESSWWTQVDVTCVGYGVPYLKDLRSSPFFQRVCVEVEDIPKVWGCGRISAVVGFPWGTPSQAEIDRAWIEGADEIDLPIPLRMVTDFYQVRSGVFESGQSLRSWLQGWDFHLTPRRNLKIILHTDLIQKVYGGRWETPLGKLAEVVAQTLGRGNPQIFMKTCTGYGPGGADPQVVRFLKKEGYRVKASGGIRTMDQVQALLDAGADLLGIGVTSAVALLPPLEKRSPTQGPTPPEETNGPSLSQETSKNPPPIR